MLVCTIVTMTDSCTNDHITTIERFVTVYSYCDTVKMGLSGCYSLLQNPAFLQDYIVYQDLITENLLNCSGQTNVFF